MPEYITILSFDPGTTVMGWVLAHYYPATGIYIVQKYGSIKAAKLAIKFKDMIEIFDQRIISLDIIEKEVDLLIDMNDPDFVVSESAFFHPKRPQAFVVLSLCINTLDRVLYNRFKAGKCKSPESAILYKLAPREVKRITSGTGKSEKLDIREAILSNSKIEFKQGIDISVFNEHECDATGVGYSFAVTIYMENIPCDTKK